MISVLEIKSATLRTKLFHGFDQKQIGLSTSTTTSERILP